MNRMDAKWEKKKIIIEGSSIGKAPVLEKELPSKLFLLSHLDNGANPPLVKIDSADSL